MWKNSQNSVQNYFFVHRILFNVNKQIMEQKKILIVIMMLYICGDTDQIKWVYHVKAFT